MRPRIRMLLTILAALAVVGAGAYVALSIPKGGARSDAVQVVAAENFWGSLAAQIGGAHVSVLSVVSDPNTDPHDYESNVSTARAFATAQLVIVNGAGYDDWAVHLLSAGSASNQVVLNVASLLGLSAGVNPHFWYDPAFVNATTLQIEHDLAAIDPAHRGDYFAHYASLATSLGIMYGEVAVIHQRFAGTEIAATESIFVYLANATGLDLVSPPSFMQAVAEGNDPPAQSVVTFQDQLKSGSLGVLVYNQQTVTPLTDSMKSLAVQYNVTLVAITETIQPPSATFQEWMAAELAVLDRALAQHAQGP